MAINEKLIVLSYSPEQESFDRDSLKNYLKINQQALLRGSHINHSPFYIAETTEEADRTFIEFRRLLAGKKPAKRKPTIAELLSEKGKNTPPKK